MTTGPGIDERLHIAPVRAAIQAAIGVTEVYEYGQVPGVDGNDGATPDIFVLFALERRTAPADRQGRASRTGWRLTTEPVGTTPNEYRWAAFKVATGLDGKSLTIDGVQSSPLLFEAGDSPRLNDGRYSAASFRTYSL